MAAEPARILVPVKRSVTLRNTVSYVLREAVESASADAPATVHFVYLATWRASDPGTGPRAARARELLDQVEVWSRYDLGEEGESSDDVRVETAVIGDDEYQFSPTDYADRLYEYAREHDLDRVVVDPEYTLVGHTTLLAPLERELAETGLDVEEAPVDRPARRTRLVGAANGARLAATFGVSFLFYTVLAGSLNAFDAVTGLMSAAIVAVSLSRIAYVHDPSLSESPGRLLRGIIYLPYLLSEIVKSNVVVSRVILDPRLPLEPRTVRIRSDAGMGLPLTTLANSITLTPGTLTVQARDRDLVVHTLIPWAREGLIDGGLERWVRFVFYGREAADLPSPRERGDVTYLQDRETGRPVDTREMDDAGGDGA